MSMLLQMACFTQCHEIAPMIFMHMPMKAPRIGSILMLNVMYFCRRFAT